jgi:putative hydrolase of the HAD superfamily
MLNAIFFDFDGTLADDGDSIREALDHASAVIRRRWPHIPHHDLIHTYRQTSATAWGDYDRYLRHLSSPEAMLMAVWRATLKHWHYHDPALEREVADIYWQHRLRHCRPYPDVVPLLSQLAARFHLCLLTNGAPAMQREKVKESGLESYFDHIFVGGEFARGKPDPAIFRAALTAADCRPEQAIHIGDSLLHDIIGAQKVGIRGVWLNRKAVQQADLSGPVREQLASTIPEYEIRALTELLACVEDVEADPP